jgi:hypothetical protein
MKRWSIPMLALVAAVLSAADAPLRTVHSQPSWGIQTKEVELLVTQLGGHMAPVTFYRDTDQPVQPYYVSPWQDEKLTVDVPVMVPLRGDFFCLPFGGNAEAYNGEKHPPHGETAGSKWSYLGTEQGKGTTTLSLTLQTKVRPGKVTKRLSLVEGQNAVYCQHVIEGFAGKTSVAHHATLAVPEKEGSLRVSVSPFRLGMTNPVLFSNPAQREYQSLQIGKTFTDLHRVPVLSKDAPDADCTAFPARLGFADLIAVCSEPADKLSGPAWVTAVNQEQGYVWFSLKDPAVLPTTVFWIENHGRHESPWNGRNRCLGLEDVCAYFAEGLVPSVQPNVLNKAGIPTAIELGKDRPTVINYIQGAARVPKDFDEVKTVEFAAGKLTLVSGKGQKVVVPVRHEFLKTGKL